MTRLIRAEWLKTGTTRAPWAIVGGLIGLTALITPFAMIDARHGGSHATSDAREALAIGPGFITALVLLTLGAVAAAGEFQHRTVVTSYLITPRRERVLAAKLIAHATLGAFVAAICTAVSFPIVLLMARADGSSVAPTRHLVGLALALVAVGALASACGVAAGSILRHQTAAVVVILVWTLFVEKLFGGFFPPVMPFGAILAAVGMGGADAPSTVASVGVIGAWTTALALAARLRFIGLDVT